MITVHLTRWRAPGWRWWSRGGLELDIDGHGVTQTYRSHDFDQAREMVLDYLRCRDVDVTDDVTVVWVDQGR
ncbi:MAG: hypothetical protein K0U78_10505 [Actinomycetia bacterium]|nr:hypothetical protein [Actinomycetes bacterium]MCH9734969.1 hypothetical protein [Actinomycetes bacterium]